MPSCFIGGQSLHAPIKSRLECLCMRLSHLPRGTHPVGWLYDQIRPIHFPCLTRESVYIRITLSIWQKRGNDFFINYQGNSGELVSKWCIAINGKLNWIALWGIISDKWIIFGIRIHTLHFVPFTQCGTLGVNVVELEAYNEIPTGNPLGTKMMQLEYKGYTLFPAPKNSVYIDGSTLTVFILLVFIFIFIHYPQTLLTKFSPWKY